MVEYTAERNDDGSDGNLRTRPRPPASVPTRGDRSRRPARHRTSRVPDGPRLDGLPLPHGDRRARAGGGPRRPLDDARALRWTIATRPMPWRSAPGSPATGTPCRADPRRPALSWPTDVLALQVGHQLDFFLGDAATFAIAPAASLRRVRPRPPAGRVRAGHARLRARGVRSLRRGRGGRAGGARRATRTTSGPSTPSRTCSRCSGRVDEGIPFLRVPRRRLGRRQPVHRPQLVAPGALPARGRRRRRGRSRSTTPRSTTPTPPACRSRCSTPARCSGACTSTATTPGPLRPARRRVGDPDRRRPWYVFNDLHASMALRRRRAARRGRRAHRRPGEPTCAATAPGHERHDDGRGRSAGEPGRAAPSPRAATTTSSPTLAPIRRTLQRFGGSHAQRDVLQRTLLESALRSGRYRVRRRVGVRAARPARAERVRLDPAATIERAQSATSSPLMRRATGPISCRPASPRPERSADTVPRTGTVTALRHCGGMNVATRCAGCHVRGAVLCRTCRFALIARPAPGTPDGIIVATAYSGRVRDVLLGLKYHNRRRRRRPRRWGARRPARRTRRRSRRRHVGADERASRAGGGIRSG